MCEFELETVMPNLSELWKIVFCLLVKIICHSNTNTQQMRNINRFLCLLKICVKSDLVYLQDLNSRLLINVFLPITNSTHTQTRTACQVNAYKSSEYQTILHFSLTVSYTHLDVYKRQDLLFLTFILTVW